MGLAGSHPQGSGPIANSLQHSSSRRADASGCQQGVPAHRPRPQAAPPLLRGRVLPGHCLAEAQGSGPLIPGPGWGGEGHPLRGQRSHRGAWTADSLGAATVGSTGVRLRGRSSNSCHARGWREGMWPGLGWAELTRCSLTFALSSPELFLPSGAKTVHQLGGLSPGPLTLGLLVQ